MSQLQSPHTVTVFDFGEAEDGSVYLAMELLAGRTLRDVLRADGPVHVPGQVVVDDPTGGRVLPVGQLLGPFRGIVHPETQPHRRHRLYRLRKGRS